MAGPLATLGGHDNCPAGRDNLLGRGHAFDGLVEVEVERIAAVRRHDDRKAMGNRLHRRVANEGTAALVCQQIIAREDRGHGLIAICRDVDEKVGRCEGNPGAVVFVDRITTGHTPARSGMSDHSRTVIVDDRRLAGDARNDSLRATAESGEEVGLDKSNDDPEIRLDVVAIQPDLRSEPRRADLDQICRVVGVVIDHAIPADDVAAEHPLKLGRRVGAMQAGPVEEGYLVVRDVGEFGEERGKDGPIGNRAGQITEYDHDALIAPGELTEGGSADWLAQGRLNGALLIRKPGEIARFDDHRLTRDPFGQPQG